MRACIQRVSRAKVTVEQRVVGAIEQGLLVLLGVAEGDCLEDARYLADKTVSLRVFEDAAGKMNRSVLESGGSVLVVSQFTLLGDVRKGRRPSFIAAAAPELADELYRAYAEWIQQQGVSVARGVFRAHMDVELVNDGPVTILLDSNKLF